MIAKPVAHLLVDLGVTRSHSRPHTSNDNPFIESHFRTFKYRPDFPKRFGCYEDAHAHCSRFFSWYNDDHRHSGIGFHTSADVHYGRAELVRSQRAEVLHGAYAAHPERFVHQAPRTAEAAKSGVDQRAEGGDAFSTVVLREICISKVDTRRAEDSQGADPVKSSATSGI